MIRRAAVLLLLPIVAAAAAGCGAEGGGAWTYSSQAEVKSFRGVTDVRRLPHSLPAGEEELVLRLDLEVEAGSVEASLEDPTGELVWRQRLEAPAGELIQESFPARAGEWTLTLEMEGASGAYDLRLVSR